MVADPRRQFLDDLREGMAQTPKAIPPRYFYDAVGSSLFEAITHLPEYGLTRADERVLARAAVALPALLGPVDCVVEWGSGSGRKTGVILSALTAQRPITYVPVDVSAAALAQCAAAMSEFASVHPVEATYLDGMDQARTLTSGARLILFLGSSIGNFSFDEARDLLRGMADHMNPGEHALIGFDLVKDRNVLITAYDDPTGVTAAFNRNVLTRANRELGTNFQVADFRHEARFNEETSQMEMWLRATEAQCLHLPDAAACLRIEAGEGILTEVSRKYRAEEITQLASDCGFELVASWTDAEWPFSEALWKRI